MAVRGSFLWVLASFTLACVGPAGCGDTEPQEEEISDDGDGKAASDIVTGRQLRGGDMPDRTFALTFDDGPGDRTSELVDYLAAEHFPATFFIKGANVAGREAVVAKTVQKGFLVANHTQNHLNLTTLPADRIVAELTATDVLLARVQPQGPFIFRAPQGFFNSAQAQIVNATPLKKYVGTVRWDVGGELTTTAAADWDCWHKHVPVPQCGALYMNEMHTRGRGIILMHDIHGRTIDMVKQILPKMRSEGYHFVPLTEVPSVKYALAHPGTTG